MMRNVGFTFGVHAGRRSHPDPWLGPEHRPPATQDSTPRAWTRLGEFYRFFEDGRNNNEDGTPMYFVQTIQIEEIIDTKVL